MLELTGVDPGDHDYRATFVPTGTSHLGSDVARSSPSSVGKIATDTALIASVSGQTVTLTATPTTSSGTLTGSVEFREGTTLLDTVDLTGGDAVLTLTDVAPGDHTYTATFVPTGTTHAGSTSPTRTVTVAKIATNTALTADVDGRTVTLTATPTTTSGSLAGAVEFRDGTARCSTPST